MFLAQHWWITGTRRIEYFQNRMGEPIAAEFSHHSLLGCCGKLAFRLKTKLFERVKMAFIRNTRHNTVPPLRMRFADFFMILKS